MSDNPTTCGNCHTENSLGYDFCSSCGQPLTRSAESALTENQAAQDTAGVFGIPADRPGGAESAHIPNTDTPVKDRLPTD